MTNGNAAYQLAELDKEKTIGGVGGMKARNIPLIDMNNFEARKPEIADQLWQASSDIGFFQVINHGIAQAQIDEAFEMTERFFALPHEVKVKLPLLKGTNVGWEFKSQVRPSTGTPDQKEYLPDHPAAHAGPLAGRQRPSWLQGGDARVRTRQLGGRHEAAVLLCPEAWFPPRLLYGLPRSAVAGISKHAAAPALSSDARRQA